MEDRDFRGDLWFTLPGLQFWARRQAEGSLVLRAEYSYYPLSPNLTWSIIFKFGLDGWEGAESSEGSLVLEKTVSDCPQTEQVSQAIEEVLVRLKLCQRDLG